MSTELFAQISRVNHDEDYPPTEQQGNYSELVLRVARADELRLGPPVRRVRFVVAPELDDHHVAPAARHVGHAVRLRAVDQHAPEQRQLQLDVPLQEEVPPLEVLTRPRQQQNQRVGRMRVAM